MIVTMRLVERRAILPQGLAPSACRVGVEPLVGQLNAHRIDAVRHAELGHQLGLQPKSTLPCERRRVLLPFSCLFYGSGYTTGHGLPRLRGQSHVAARPPLVGGTMRTENTLITRRGRRAVMGGYAASL